MARSLQGLPTPHGLFSSYGAVVLGAALLCAVLEIGLGCSPATSDSSPEGSLPEIRAEVGFAVHRALESASHHTYRLQTDRDSVFEASVAQDGIDLVLMVTDAADTPRLQTDRAIGGSGSEPLTFLAEAGVPYFLDLWSREEPDPERVRGSPGGYRLEVVDVHPPTARDRLRSAVDRSFAAGEQLRGRADWASGQEAMASYERALHLALQLGEAWPLAEIQDRLGVTLRKYLERSRDAVPYLRRALLLYAALGQTWQQANTLNILGRAHYELGEMEAAETAWTEALALAEKGGLATQVGASSNNLALLHRYSGNPQRALAFYDRGIALLRQEDRGKDLGTALHNRGRFYHALGQPEQAERDFAEARNLGEKSGDLRLQALALTGLGRIDGERGDLEPAVSTLRQALALREAYGEERGRAFTLGALASVLESQGRAAEAQDLQRQAQELFHRTEMRRGEAGSLEALARFALADGDLSEAVSLSRRALALYRGLGDASGRIRCLDTLARSERRRGDLAAARSYLEAALQGIEGLRGRAFSHDLRRSYLASRRGDFELAVRLLMELHDREPGAGYDALALAASERFRARSLVDLLSEEHDRLLADADPKLIARQAEIEGRIHFLEGELVALADGPRTGERPRVEAALGDLLRELRALDGHLRAESPVYGSLTRPRILDAAQIQNEVLDPGSMLLEIHLGEERSYLWAVTTSSLASFELPSRQVLEDAARRAHALLRESHRVELRESAQEAAGELSHLLLEPLASHLDGKHLDGGIERLLVVAEGALQYIPFAVLPLPGSGPPVPLAERYEVVDLPSASALAALRQRLSSRPPAPRLLALIADPIFEPDDPRLLTGSQRRRPRPSSRSGETLQRLRFSGDEARALARLVDARSTRIALGADATREALLDRRLADFRLVHLATHGRLDTQRPELSQLIFSRYDVEGRKRPSSVHAHEIFNLKLNADLVVLSACETGLGQEIPGEGLVGLPQGFLYAGAAAVLVSLWQVDDRATAELMERFYRRLLVDGERPASALRQAQLSLRREQQWRAPYFWAGFVLQGEWR